MLSAQSTDTLTIGSRICPMLVRRSEAMRDVENDTLAAGYEAMFEDKWDGTQAAMMGAGWEAMIDMALSERKAEE